MFSGRDRICGGLVLIGKAAVLKTAGRKPLGVRLPRPPPRLLNLGRGGRVAEGARLLSVCGETHRGFESLPLRQNLRPQTGLMRSDEAGCDRKTE